MAGHFPTSKLPPMAAGQRYGRLVAIEFAERPPEGHARWRFRCDCGNEVTIRDTTVRSGDSTSCGCFYRERMGDNGRARKIHGKRGAPEYSSWSNMLQRCRNPKNPKYKIYGGRGIKVCERWSSFENFYADMGPRPSPEHSLDRFPNNDGDYEPGNVRWAMPKAQSRNRTTNAIITFRGIEMPLIEACELARVNYRKVQKRLSRGWSVERAFVP